MKKAESNAAAASVQKGKGGTFGTDKAEALAASEQMPQGAVKRKDSRLLSQKEVHDNSRSMMH